MAATSGKRHEWSPPFAQHVRGYYHERVIDEDGLPEEAEVGAHCDTCGQDFKRLCTSGLMRQHISNFATVHLHRDVLAPIPKVET